MSSDHRSPLGRSRSALLVGAVVLAAAAALTAGLLVGGSTSQPGARAATWLKAPLASSFATASGSWAILPMGNLSDPLNTFWQLFFRPSGRSDWRLVTPPGVADNGGIAASPGPDGSVAVVFAPNNLLTFSPFAITSDNGSAWSPGVIPLGIAPVPDVVTAPLASGAQFSALERGGSAVAVGTGNESNWATLFTSSQLAGSPAAGSCGAGQLTALAASGSDDLLRIELHETRSGRDLLEPKHRHGRRIRSACRAEARFLRRRVQRPAPVGGRKPDRRVGGRPEGLGQRALRAVG